MNGVKIFQIHAGGFDFISKCFDIRQVCMKKDFMNMLSPKIRLTLKKPDPEIRSGSFTFKW